MNSWPLCMKASNRRDEQRAAGKYYECHYDEMIL
jgi:hypothetical protein